MGKKRFLSRLTSVIVNSSNEGWGSQVYPVDMLQYDDNDEAAVVKKKDMTARLAWMEAGGYYGYEKSIRETLQENYARGKHGFMDVTFAKYLLDGRAVWVFEYEHNTKTVDNIPWYKWYELPEKERDQWHPTIRYGVKSDNSDDDLLDMPKVWPDDKEFITAFAEAFWEMAGVWLGMKLDKDVETVQLKVPKHNNGQMPNFVIGITGKSVYLRVGFNLSANDIESLSDDDRYAFTIAIQEYNEELQKVLSGLGNHSLKGEEGKEPKGAKETDYDLLRKAFKWVQKNVPGCRDGYADEGVAMINDNEERKRPIKVILADMKLSGVYGDVIARYEELKKKPKDSSSDEDGDTKSEEGSEPKPVSGDMKLKIENFERADKKLRGFDEVAKKLPFDWDRTFGTDPIYSEARKKGVLMGLPFVDTTAFELCLKFWRAGQEAPAVIEAFAEKEFEEASKVLAERKH